MDVGDWTFGTPPGGWSGLKNISWPVCRAPMVWRQIRPMDNWRLPGPAKNEGAHLREAEGDEWSLRSTSLKTGTCEEWRSSPSGGRRWQMITQKQKLEDQNLRRIPAPEGYWGQSAIQMKDFRTIVGSGHVCKTWIREKVGFVHLSHCNFIPKPAVSEL